MFVDWRIAECKIHNPQSSTVIGIGVPGLREDLLGVARIRGVSSVQAATVPFTPLVLRTSKSARSGVIGATGNRSRHRLAMAPDWALQPGGDCRFGLWRINRLGQLFRTGCTREPNGTVAATEVRDRPILRPKFF